jgi:hypothetical protein
VPEEKFDRQPEAGEGGLVWAALLLCVASTPDGGAADAGLNDEAPALRFAIGLEADLGILPSGYGGNAGGLDGIFGVRPLLALTASDVFFLEFGPRFRLRFGDTEPRQDGTEPQRRMDLGRVLRLSDWDEASDFGQILDGLGIGREGGPVSFRAGPVTKRTVGLGFVVFRYSNRENPDYHPAAGTLVASLGPLRLEAFASDILGARLFAGHLQWDIARTFTSDEAVIGRYHLALELAGDIGIAGRLVGTNLSAPAPGASLIHVSADAMLHRSRTARLLVLTGFGTRLNSAGNVGLTLGGAADLSLDSIGLTFRAELRKQAGGFRHGYFGPQYELSRFAGTGFSGAALADELLPDTFSGFGEIRVGVGQHVWADVALEGFGYGRLDLDATIGVAALEGKVQADARVTVVAAGQAPRLHFSAGAKIRVLPALYILARAGTLFFAQPDGSLQRGITAFAGLGVDFETKSR